MTGGVALPTKIRQLFAVAMFFDVALQPVQDAPVPAVSLAKMSYRTTLGNLSNRPR